MKNSDKRILMQKLDIKNMVGIYLKMMINYDY